MMVYVAVYCEPHEYGVPDRVEGVFSSEHKALCAIARTGGMTSDYEITAYELDDELKQYRR